MKQIFVLIIGALIAGGVQGQFTQIPTGTTANIGGITLHGDTLIIVGHPDYFAKYCVTTGDLTVLSSPGISGYANFCFQVVQDNYYVFSRQVGNYDHNYILKSTSYGNSWDTLFDTPGLFYTLSMADSTFGVLGGAYGSHAITDGSDTDWALDTVAGGVFTSSATYGDSTAILEGTSKSYLSHDREFTWDDDLNGAFGLPKQTQFLNQDTIFSLSNQSGTTSYFRRLTYNGSTWSSMGTNINPCTLDVTNYNCYSESHSMQMNNDGTGYILAYVESYLITSPWHGEVIDRASIFYTEDYGSSWTSYVTDIPEIMYCMAFLNDTTAFIAGQNGLLYKWDLTVPLSNQLSTQAFFTNNELQLFPNPFSHTATFTLATANTQFPLVLHIYDQLGREVRTETIQSSEFTFYRNGLNAGVYYYRINDYSGKFVIAD